MTITITSLHGREILDSRGRPTVEVDLMLSDETTARASVPSGASTGRHEAVERRDGDPDRYRGRGVLGAVAAVNGEIAAAIVGAEPDLAAVDARLIALDGTPDKARLGANAILAVSLATARAEAARAGVPLWRHLAGASEAVLPMPMANIISGGLHAGRQLDFQDFLIMPVGAGSYHEALRWIVEVHESTADVLRERGLTALKADEGGFGPPLASHAAALELLDTAVERAGLRLGDDVAYALDIAATHFYDASAGRYVLASEDRTCTPDELAALIGDLAARHPILSVEDALAEDDWDGWTALTDALGPRMQVVGDDFFTTNIERLERGIATGAANAVLVKMNQIGTITETLAVVERAKRAGYRTVISARSGETEDPALADLAVGTAGGQIKIGSVAQSERLAKYNQLLRIEEALGGDDAPYAGRGALALERVA
ncbi:Enolase 2 [Baekduia alba]|uniref:phosphopyruvate hydratase n=1 Tax=Baekduia alba TaxID=2997333 RepID=UPI00233F8814|nr:phosphopyruvate hydratase [Baekduia alba]WCB93304.1 Enolase 2 [Baekduia alba]